MAKFIQDLTDAIKETFDAAQKGINKLANPTPKFVNCPYCGGSNKYEDAKCSHCGAPIKHKTK